MQPTGDVLLGKGRYQAQETMSRPHRMRHVVMRNATLSASGFESQRRQRLSMIFVIRQDSIAISGIWVLQALKTNGARHSR